MRARKRHDPQRRSDGFVATYEKGIPRRTSVLARFLILFTFIAWLVYIVEQSSRLNEVGYGLSAALETGLSLILVSALTLSALAYLLARLGYFERLAVHRRTPFAEMDDEFDLDQPSATVLVPSYREDIRVIRQTLLSAALQEYAELRIVLLIDDPPGSQDPAQERLLQQARDVPGEIVDLLEPQYQLYKAALEKFEEGYKVLGPSSQAELEGLAELYLGASDWLGGLANDTCTAPDADHTDEFLAAEVFDRLGADLTSTAKALQQAASTQDATISKHRLRQLHRRLVWIFHADVWSFERKQFASLSHEPNKAMNLNSYLSLMGKRYSIETSPGARVLVERSDAADGLEIPDSDYVVTLDADSVLLPEYCLRLVHFMEQPENARIAVAQTPYSSYPGAGSALERIAGATTDVQHIVHQGLVRFGATFWVGANAVLRKSAVDELRSESMEKGFPIARYIADRTVIEDTESSVDLRSRGWQLYNYPERLSYSATPPDFGSLVVQRKRWANGGLLVLGRLSRLFRDRKDTSSGVTVAEVFLRFSYLASISWVSLGLTVLLLFPFDQRLLSVVAVATSLPYFFATASDLHRCGYHRRDVFGVYALNLILLPVNLAGTLSSIMQAIGGHKVDFARTPKVKDRTSAPLIFVIAPFLLLLWSAYSAARDIDDGVYIRAVFAGTNTLALLYALVVYIGPIAALVDVAAGLREKTRVPVKARSQSGSEVPEWAAVLFVGEGAEEDVDWTAPLALALSSRDQLLTVQGGVKTGPIALGPITEAPPTSEAEGDLVPSHAGSATADSEAEAEGAPMIDLRLATASKEPFWVSR